MKESKETEKIDKNTELTQNNLILNEKEEKEEKSAEMQIQTEIRSHSQKMSDIKYVSLYSSNKKNL